MRTTLTIHDDIAEILKKRAFQTKRSFEDMVNETLQVGLSATDRPLQPEPYRLEPACLGDTPATIDPDKAVRLADALEDEEIGGKKAAA